MKDITFLTATELAPLIQTKQLSPVELTNRMFERIDEINPDINAYITPLSDLALQQAKEAENSIMNDQYKGPLHGIPIGIKDNYSTKGIRTTAGTKIWAENIPAENATTIERLLEVGGILLGKLNMHQLGDGSTGINPFYGSARNPWNSDYMTGGSSSGSAASLAAGMTTLATGTDTWGSNRIPAAMCGVYGLKPTYGLVSTHGLIPTTFSLDHPGPYARSASDLALLLHYMAGFDPKDPSSLNVSVPNYTSDLNQEITGVTIGVPTYYTEGLDPDVDRLFKQALTTLEGLGAKIQEIAIPELSMAAFAGYITAAVEGATINHELLQTHLQDYAEDSRALFLAGATTPGPKYVKAQQVRRKMATAFKKAFENVDIILGPTFPSTTPAFQENWVAQNLEVVKSGLPFTVPANLTGIPSLSVPIGLCSKGLPVGMQLMGDHLSEKQLLQVANAWEHTSPLCDYPLEENTSHGN